MQIVTVQENLTISQVLDNYFAHLISSEIVRLIKERDIKINGVRISGKNDEVKAGDEVRVYDKPNKTRDIFEIVYEDDDIIIVDKESGVNSEGVSNFLKTRGDYRFVHRLDRNTVGLMLFAKNDESERNALEGFRTHTVQKYYEAVCVGNIPEKKARKEAFLKKNALNSTVTIHNKKIDGAVKIITSYEVMRTDGLLSLVKVKLETGRTHQIRAHFAFMGYPILGDTKYGQRQINEKYKISRQLLVSKKLTLFGISKNTEGKSFESKRSFASVLKEQV